MCSVKCNKSEIQAGGLSAVYSSLLINLVKLYEEMKEVKRLHIT